MDKWLRVASFLFLIALGASGNPVDSLRFFKVKADLSQNSITRIIQDQEGYLWFATRYGLNRYDGENVLSFYGMESRNGVLGNSFIKDLTLDSAGRLHIATFGGGVSVYDDGTFSELDKAAKLTDLLVNNVAIDHNGELWIGTDKTGVIRVPLSADGKVDHANLEHYRHYAGDPYTLSGNSISGLAADGQGNVWVGTWDHGLNVYLQESKRFIRFNSEKNDDLPGNIIRCISTAPDGSVWVGFQRGIRQIRYTNGGYKVSRSGSDEAVLPGMLEDLTVLSVLEDNLNRLWIGTENEGLIVVDLKSGEYGQYKKDPDNPFSVGSNSIWSLYQDNAGTIWIGTFDQGVFKVDPHEVRFDHIAQIPYSRNTLSHSLVSSFAPDMNGGLWIGTDGGGLNYMSADGSFEVFNPENSPLRSSSVLSLHRSRDGNNLYIGGWRNGLSLIKGSSGDIMNFPFEGGAEGTGGRFIFDLHEDAGGNIWIASFRTGIDVYLDDRKEFLHFEPGDPERYITANTVQAVTVGPDGVIWIGTEGSGIDRLEINDQYQTSQLKNYSISTSQGADSRSSITALFTDSKNRLWVGTRGDGLAMYNKNKDAFETITTTEGLPSNLIYSIEEDQEGKLWLSTNKGIISYDPDGGRVESFDIADGLQGPEFFPRSSYTMSDGTMLFGGINGFNRFHPSRIASIPSNGSVYITSLQTTGPGNDQMYKAFTAGHESDNQVELDYKNNDFSITFSYLNFTQSAKNRYQYQLEGYDEDWQDVGTRNTAFYTNVPSGKYNFHVRAANADQVWNERPASLSIRVRPPWYGSWWAYTVYGVIVLGFLSWRRRTIIQREKLKNKLALEHLELEKLKELDEIKSRFFANISHEFRTPLTLILSPLKSMLFDEDLKSHHGRLRSMGRQAERLLGFINQILDLSKLESGSANLEASKIEVSTLLQPLAYTFTDLATRQYIRYKVMMPDKPVFVYADRDKLEKIVTNLLSNAFKFTPDFGEIIFKVSKPNDREVCISVSDTGKGIDQENLEHIFARYFQGEHEQKRKGLGTGIGLALTKELVELHKGRIQVTSRQDEGATFEVYLLLGKSHLQENEIIDKDTELREKQFEPVSMSPERSDKSVSKPKNKSSRGKILITEDNAEIRNFIREYLEGEFDILEAPDGVRALELVQNQKPDLVITDILMPGMDGLELVKAIKSDEALNHISTIMLTAKASASSMEKGYELGADFYITKPFNPTHLRLQINNILKARRNYKKRVKSGNDVNLAPKEVEPNHEEEEFVSNVMQVIEQHISDPGFTVNDLCKAMGMSRMQLYRKLKSHISMSANELIRHVRLQRSAQLLKNGQHSVSEITYMVGFTDLQYFRTSFKKNFGVNPSDYK